MQNILLLFIISTLRNINLLNLHILKMTLFIYIVKNAMRELGVLFLSYHMFFKSALATLATLDIPFLFYCTAFSMLLC